MIDDLKKKLESLQPSDDNLFVIGFDGFTDEIIDVVSHRSDINSYDAFPTIKAFAERIDECQNKSANIELYSKQVKLGGNAPILCNALLAQGHSGTFIGPIGDKGAIEPLFQEMANGCKDVITLGPSAHTDALEFADGKLMLGKHAAIRNINFKSVLQAAGKDRLVNLFSNCKLFGNTTWTLILGMNDLWKGIIKDILPDVEPLSSNVDRHMFVDLCDPTKRSEEELLEAIQLLQDFKPWFHVALGLNVVEIQKVATCLGFKGTFNSEEDFEKSLRFIGEETRFSSVVLHTKKYGMVYHTGEVSRLDVEHCVKPLISTGAGDNFNAGFCGGLLLGLSAPECLQLGITTSGFYIRNGHSASIPEVIANLHSFQ